MNIGVDVDGVLNDLETYQLKYGRLYFSANPIVDATAYDIQEIFACTRYERQNFWRRYIWKYCLIEPARENASTNLCLLRELGHNIYIITSRAYVSENGLMGFLFRRMLTRWLKRQKIPFNEIVFCSESHSATEKAEACKKLEIDVMLEDKIDNIEAIAPIAKVICFNAAWNRNLSIPEITRVGSFDEAYKTIISMI